MNEAPSDYLEVGQLTIGMFIELEVGWMSHPFPTGSFKISSSKQIDIIKSLGLSRIRYFPGKSDSPDEAPQTQVAEATITARMVPAALDVALMDSKKQRQEALAAQQRDLVICERRFVDGIRQYKQVLDQLKVRPQSATTQSLALVTGLVDDMMGHGESSIRLLSEGMGDKSAMHPVNVTIISLLLGKTMALTQAELLDLGIAAFLHDMGKIRLPDRVRLLDENFSTAEYKLYQEHVMEGVALAKAMSLTLGARQAIAQHHELMDGSGFPTRAKGDSLSTIAKILALVNRYDTLCNPGRPVAAITPHEALSLIFAQLRNRYDPVTLSAFIRMMGVYPPGSVVQLVDERFAIVVSVNSTRPLKPRLIVCEPGIPKDEALILDLERTPSIGIKRSLKPGHLPKAAFDYLSPRQRICYFFERAVEYDHAPVST
jgi:HD-GYP domain-containing protein (c-di-GMP phosphodiesterase class II)